MSVYCNTHDCIYQYPTTGPGRGFSFGRILKITSSIFSVVETDAPPVVQLRGSRGPGAISTAYERIPDASMIIATRGEKSPGYRCGNIKPRRLNANIAKDYRAGETKRYGPPPPPQTVSCGTEIICRGAPLIGTRLTGHVRWPRRR